MKTSALPSNAAARNAVLRHMGGAAPYALDADARSALARSGDARTSLATLGDLTAALVAAVDVDLPALPAGVDVRWSVGHCCYFYYDAASGATTWERPAAPKQQPPESQ